MSRASSFFHHRRVDTLSIIADQQDKSVITIANLGLDVLRVRMLEGISQQLTTNSEDLVSDARRQVLPLTSDDQLKGWTIRVATNRCLQFLTGRSQQFSEISRGGVFDPQIFNSVAALGGCLLGSLNRTIHGFERFSRATRKQISSSLKAKHETVQSLEQCIVQFSRNPHAFVHARV